MKKIAAIAIILAFLVQNTSQLWIWISFEFNRDYIAKNLCINRFDAISLCKGSCILEKELNKDQKEQQKTPELKNKEVNLFIEMKPATFLPPVSYTRSVRQYPHLYIGIPAEPSIGTVFHPPILIV